MTEIEIGRSKFLEKIKEGRERLNRMEEEALEVNYKAKYEKLVSAIKIVEASARQCMEDFPEPNMPDTIDDRKKVIWYRNDVFEHAHAVGTLSACLRILDAAGKS